MKIVEHLVQTIQILQVGIIHIIQMVMVQIVVQQHLLRNVELIYMNQVIEYVVQ